MDELPLSLLSLEGGGRGASKEDMMEHSQANRRKLSAHPLSLALAVVPTKEVVRLDPDGLARLGLLCALGIVVDLDPLALLAAVVVLEIFLRLGRQPVEFTVKQRRESVDCVRASTTKEK